MVNMVSIRMGVGVWAFAGAACLGLRRLDAALSFPLFADRLCGLESFLSP